MFSYLTIFIGHHLAIPSTEFCGFDEFQTQLFYIIKYISDQSKNISKQHFREKA